MEPKCCRARWLDRICNLNAALLNLNENGLTSNIFERTMLSLSIVWSTQAPSHTESIQIANGLYSSWSTVLFHSYWSTYLGCQQTKVKWLSFFFKNLSIQLAKKERLKLITCLDLGWEHTNLQSKQSIMIQQLWNPCKPILLGVEHPGPDQSILLLIVICFVRSSWLESKTHNHLILCF